MSEFITVAKVGDIPSGEGRAFECHDRVVAVFNENETYRAIDDMCPHMGASLAAGHFDCDSGVVTCPWHAWSFDTRDGAWCDNRRLKTDVFEVRVEGDEIQVAPIDPPPSPDGIRDDDANKNAKQALPESNDDAPSSPDSTKPSHD